MLIEINFLFFYGVEQEWFIFLGDLNYLSSKSINNALKEFSNTNYDAIGFNLKSNNQTFIGLNVFGCGFNQRMIY